MSLQPIPEAWRVAVMAALKARRYQFTAEGRKLWQNGFPGAFSWELIDDLCQTLSLPGACGCPVQMDYPDGVTWEFWFWHQGHKTYGKILLKPDQMNVLLLSAHHPRKDTLHCE